MNRQAYPSDLSDTEWQLLEPLLPAPKPGGRPVKYPRREVVNAIMYVLRSGCAWRNPMYLLALAATLPVPSDQLLPSNGTVGHYFRHLVPAFPLYIDESGRSVRLDLHAWQRWSTHRLPDGQEPVVRVLLAVSRPAGYELHLSPLLLRSIRGPFRPTPQIAPLPSGVSATAFLNSGVTITPTANSISSKRSSWPFARYLSNSWWYRAVSKLTITLFTPFGNCATASVRTRFCW